MEEPPCASTEIHVFRGADSAEYQEENKFVKVFLKRTKKAKQNLEKHHPEMYRKINEIWEFKRRHSCQDVPHKYVFYLYCCYEEGCMYPRCTQGRSEVEPACYPDGPPLSFVPLPARDPELPVRWDACRQCKPRCSGHYLKPGALKEAFTNGTYIPAKRPSDMLLFTFKAFKHEMPSQNSIIDTSKEVLLSPEDTNVVCSFTSNTSQLSYWGQNICREKGDEQGNKNWSKSKAKAKCEEKY